MACHRRDDRLGDVGDIAVRLPDRDRPVRGAAHHHSLEHCLPAYGIRHSSKLRRLGGLRPFETALEPLYPATRVDELLLPGVERVAVRADLDVQLLLRRARLELVSARAVDGCEHVLGMDAGLHRRARIAAVVSAATLPPETTTPTALAPSSGTFPARSAAMPAAAAGSQASFARL